MILQTTLLKCLHIEPLGPVQVICPYIMFSYGTLKLYKLGMHNNLKMEQYEHAQYCKDINFMPIRRGECKAETQRCFYFL